MSAKIKRLCGTTVRSTTTNANRQASPNPLGFGTTMASLRRPWWLCYAVTVPDVERSPSEGRGWGLSMQTQVRGSSAMKKLVTAALALLLGVAALISLGAAHAQTLDRIFKDKKIRVAVEVDSPPFGVLDKAGEPDGLEIAAVRQLAKDLGVTLEMVKKLSG